MTVVWWVRVGFVLKTSAVLFFLFFFFFSFFLSSYLLLLFLLFEPDFILSKTHKCNLR